MTTINQRHSSRPIGYSKRLTSARRWSDSALRIVAIAILFILSSPQPQRVAAAGALAPAATYVVDRVDDSSAAAQRCGVSKVNSAIPA